MQQISVSIERGVEGVRGVSSVTVSQPSQRPAAGGGECLMLFTIVLSMSVLAHPQDEQDLAKDWSELA